MAVQVCTKDDSGSKIFTKLENSAICTTWFWVQFGANKHK